MYILISNVVESNMAETDKDVAQKCQQRHAWRAG